MSEDFAPPTALEASARALGADTARYRIDYLMLPMRDAVRLETIVIRPSAEGGYPTLLVRSPYPHTSLDFFGGLCKPLFEKGYADVFVKLVDVYPDGVAYNLAETAVRMRYRDGVSQPANLVPGEVYRIELRGITTANYFGPGHQIRVEIAGSSFPNADRNWHTGGRNDLATDGPIAHLTLHHGGDHPSRIRVREYLGAVEPKPAPEAPAQPEG